MMQENMRRMQESLATLEVEGQSAAGMVKVQMTCKYEVKRVSMIPALIFSAMVLTRPCGAASLKRRRQPRSSSISRIVRRRASGQCSPAFTSYLKVTALHMPAPELPFDHRAWRGLFLHAAHVLRIICACFIS